MYPHSRGGKLIFYCKTCANPAQVSDPLVFKHKFVNVENVDSKMPNRNIVLDPTLPRDRTLECKHCGASAPVYFQPSEESMQLIYACRTQTCGHMGKLSDFCSIEANHE